MHINPAELPESFLQFAWRARYIHPGHILHTNCGQPVEILHPGYWNHDQGPDFLQARLRINGVLWQGHVEIHIQSREWYSHQHQKDKGYNGVILHVAMEAGKKPIFREDGTMIPEVAVGKLIPDHVYKAYHRLMLNEAKLACEGQWPKVPAIVKQAWFTRLAFERMERRASGFKDSLKAIQWNWNQAMWQALAAYMGGPVNKEAFIHIAKTIPVKLLNAYKTNFIQQEALLFGAAGLLHTHSPANDRYYQQLRTEWLHLRRKHSLPKDVVIPLKFHRMRPASFPTIRLSQLASICRHWPQLTSLLSREGVQEFMQIPLLASHYWNRHYVFGKEGKKREKTLGRSHKEALIINNIAPLGLVFQQVHHGKTTGDWLEDVLAAMAPEKNRHTRLFMHMGFLPSNAIATQGMIECYTQYCLNRRCLDCAIGACLLGKKSPTLNTNNIRLCNMD